MRIVLTTAAVLHLMLNVGTHVDAFPLVRMAGRSVESSRLFSGMSPVEWNRRCVWLVFLFCFVFVLFSRFQKGAIKKKYVSHKIG